MNDESMSDEIVAGEAGSAPEMPELPSPVDWMSMSVHEWADELGRLRLWVAHMASEWAVPASVIPPCWEQHASLVQLLSALRDAYETLYHEMQPGTGSVDWQRYWSWARQELTVIVGGLRCTVDAHYAERIQEWARSITEDGEASEYFIAEDERVSMTVRSHVEKGRSRDALNVTFVDFSRGRG